MNSGLIDGLKRGLSLQRCGLDILLCLIGTTATLVSTLYDDWLTAPMKQRGKILVRIELTAYVFSLTSQKFRFFSCNFSYLCK